MQPPTAPRHEKTLTIHGHTRIDPYFWLNDRGHPDVLAYIEAENAYTEAALAHTGSLQETLYQEMLSRIQQTDQDVPERRGKFEYYTRTEEGLQYKIYCRRPAGQAGPEEVLLDLNQYAADSGFVRLGIYKPSPDHSLLAFSLDLDGSEEYTVFFKDLSTGEILPDEIPNTGYDGEWANDNRTYFYTTKDDAWRDFRLHRYLIGEGTGTLVFQEDDQLFNVSLHKTRDQAYLVLSLDSIQTSECRVLDAGRPEDAFRTVHPREHGVEYGLDHRAGLFYIWTNADALNFKVVTAPVDQPQKSNWEAFVPYNPAVKIDRVDCFADHVVCYQRENGLRTIRIYSPDGQDAKSVAFPEVAYAYHLAENPEFETHLLRFTYTSPITPDSVIDYDMDTGEWTVRKRKPVPGGYDPEAYTVRRTFATAEDGNRIPITLLQRKEAKYDGNNPCLLYGYGSYGISMDPGFNANVFSLVDRGFVYAIAHIRGGGEMGRGWYEDGKFLHKNNTFTDFIACGRHLVAAGCTTHDRMAIMGRSAGGLLIGAVVNLAPDLSRAAIAGVPFVDVVTTMLDTTIPLTVGEFEEWGNPQDPEYYRYMLAYSPYDNVEAQDYPHLLATSGLNDPRVQYWEPTKWVAKLRATGHGPNRLLLKTNMGAGHAGASGRFDALRERAFEYAFLLDALGVEES